jgi:hypothetical protein
MSNTTPTPNLCKVCNAPAASKCQRCKDACYCSRSCQKKNWSTHKKVCRAPVVCQKVEGAPVVCQKVEGAPRRVFPIQDLVWDAIRATLRSYLSTPDTPTTSTLVCFNVDTLGARLAEYGLAFYDWSLPAVDELVRSGTLSPGGVSHTALSKTIVDHPINTLAVIVRINKLEDREKRFMVVSATDTALLLDEVSGEVSGYTRIAAYDYETIRDMDLNSQIPLVLTGLRVPGSPGDAMVRGYATVGSPCVVCMEPRESFVLSSCGHEVCHDCGMQWKTQCDHDGTTASCPMCRSPWSEYDHIYGSSRRFSSIRCCWCNKTSSYQCRCRRFEYCSLECKAAHGDCSHRTDCYRAWCNTDQGEMIREDQVYKWCPRTDSFNVVDC